MRSTKLINKKSAGNADKILNINSKHHIIFTDGGCHPNNKSKQSRGGYAAIFISGPLSDKRIYGNLNIVKFNASNIRAEGMAIIRALELINQTKCINSKGIVIWNKITVISDTEFWIKMVELYMPKWTKEKFKEKSNSDLTKRLWIVYKELSQKCNVSFMHMKSHNKNGWKSYEEGTFERFCYDQNDYVDILCTYARHSLKPKEEHINSIVYYK
jgi:ribonuclease HI